MLAEFGRFPLQIHFWQQILRYHNKVCALPNSRLDKLALIDSFGMSILLIGLKHFQAIGDLMCGGLLTYMGNRLCMTSWSFPTLLSEKKRAGLWTFFLTQSIAACNSIGLSTKPIIQITSILTIFLLSDAILTGD